MENELHVLFGYFIQQSSNNGYMMVVDVALKFSVVRQNPIGFRGLKFVVWFLFSFQRSSMYMDSSWSHDLISWLRDYVL